MRGARDSRRVRAAFEISATVAMLIAASILVWENWPTPSRSAITPPRTPGKPISLGSAPIKGAETARIGIVVFSEFQCPFCGAVARGALKAIETKYVATGRVRLAFRHFPLAKHTLARGAAAASICARDKFWEMHDLFFGNQDKLTDTDIRHYAAQIKLDSSEFDACRNAAKTEAEIDGDLGDGRALRVSGTPTVYLGVIQSNGMLQVTDVLVGARPLADFARILDRLLSSSAGQ